MGRTLDACGLGATRPKHAAVEIIILQGKVPLAERSWPTSLNQHSKQRPQPTPHRVLKGDESPTIKCKEKDLNSLLIHLVCSLHLLLLSWPEARFTKEVVGITQRPRRIRQWPLPGPGASATRESKVIPGNIGTTGKGGKQHRTRRLAHIQAEQRRVGKKATRRLVNGQRIPPSTQCCCRQHSRAGTHLNKPWSMHLLRRRQANITWTCGRGPTEELLGLLDMITLKGLRGWQREPQGSKKAAIG